MKKKNNPLRQSAHGGEEKIIKKDKIKGSAISQEMQSSYLDYAMSVIVSRALPDARDGLKPVQRRILYTMSRMGLKHNTRFRKSAAIVGEVMGKYHPHGDASIYEAMVRMAQDFSLRYPLVTGQGNFGSIDSDPPAAARYTEARLSKIGEEILTDLDKGTVTFAPNYDETLKEPTVLPAGIPNLLLNGAMGIAVGMATNIPPHNLNEICQSLKYLIDHPKAELDELVQFVKGPDFPTGGIIFDSKQIKEVYASGKGAITMRAKTETESQGLQKNIIIKEIPYQVNKADLLLKIAELVKDKRIEGIRDVRDESTEQGIRIVIELKKDISPKNVLNRLFKLTDLQTNFNTNLVALEKGIQPKLFSFKELLASYLSFRQQVIKKRAEFNLERIKERLHILAGLQIALLHIDKVISLIKRSKNRQVAKKGLMKKFKLSDKQTEAILEMRLHQIAGLERLAVEKESKEKKKQAKELKALLASPKKILGKIKEELVLLSEKYNQPRRTDLKEKPAEILTEADIVIDRPVLVALTQDGYIKRLAPDKFKTQIRGGKGIAGLEMKEEDKVKNLLFTNLHADILFFTNKGKVFSLKAFQIPETGKGKGKPLINFLSLSSEEKISEFLSAKSLFESDYLILITKKGIIKKVKTDCLKNIRRSGIVIINLRKDDSLQGAVLADKGGQLLLVTAQGQALRFQEKDLRPMGRAATGVKALGLKKEDYLIDLSLIKKGAKNLNVLTISANGFGKMTPLKFYRLQRRGGRGIKTTKNIKKTGELVGCLILTDEEINKKDFLLISSKGVLLRIELADIPKVGRATQGVRLMRFKKEEDKVVSMVVL